MSQLSIEKVDPFDLPDEEMPARPVPDSIAALRGHIDQIDLALVDLLAKRLTLVTELRKEKDKVGWPVFDPAREAAVVRSAASAADHLGLDAETVREIVWRIIRLSRSVQRRETT